MKTVAIVLALALGSELPAPALAQNPGEAATVAAPQATSPAPASPGGPEAPGPSQRAAPPVEGLVATALERSPSLAALAARLAAAREMVAPAGALPDPMVELMLTSVGFPRYTVGREEMSMLGAELRQALPWPGAREARREVARGEAAVISAETEMLRRQLAAEVRMTYARLHAIDAERRALAAAHELLDLLAATVTARYSVGASEQEAVIKTQLEASRLAERQDDLAAERARLAAAISRLLDQRGEVEMGEVASLPEVVLPQPPWHERAVAGATEVAVARAAVAAAERRVAVARIELKPSLITGASAGLRGGMDPSVTLRFGAELPFWRKDKQLPMLRAAEHDLAVAQAELRGAEAAVRAEAATLAAEWVRAERQIIRYRQAILPQSSAAMDAARSAYLVGRGDFSTVIEDFRAWLDARIELAGRESDRFATWAAVVGLLGEEAGAGGSGLGAGQEPAAAREVERTEAGGVR